MRSGEFSDEDFVRTLAASGARALVIGRRALILLGAPVLTADYDLWAHIDDVEKLNAAFATLEHVPNRSPEDARRLGRYVLENGEHVDVMVARAKADARARLDFDSAWARRQTIEAFPGVSVHLPCIEDLITTKRWASPVSPYDDVLPPDEFERRLAEALESARGPEGAEMAELIAWFKRRYPRPIDRLRYATRKYAEAERLREQVQAHRPARGAPQAECEPPHAPPYASGGR